MQILITLEPELDADADEVDQLTGQLRGRLLTELDVDSVTRPAGKTAVHNAKTVESVSLAALSVTLSPILLRSLVHLLQSWLKHRPVRTVKVSIGDNYVEVNKATTAQQQQLIDAFIEGHTPK